MLKSRWKRMLFGICLMMFVLFGFLTTILTFKKDQIVNDIVQKMNSDFMGQISIKEVKISPFINFPYISIDLKGVKVFQDKSIDKAPILDLNDLYVGFDLWTILSGKYNIKLLKFKDGKMHIVQDVNGDFNIAKALASRSEKEVTSEALHLDLQKIEITDVEIYKINEQNNILIDLKINNAKSRLKLSDTQTSFTLDTRFLVTAIKGSDTTFIKNKRFEIETKLSYNNVSQILKLQPSEIKLEDAFFKMQGKVDFDNDMDLDLKFEGAKPNFDLFIAFAPEELIPVLKKYDNKGKVYFDCTVKGKSVNGFNPKIDANFGCSEAYFTNKINDKKLDKLQFKGHFTNGEARNASTSEFSIINFGARPEAGLFSGNLTVKNFDSPDIKLKLISDFQLDFLAKFLNLESLKNLKGSVKLTMNFRDILDLEHPERSIEKLNESYFTELLVKDLSFSSPDYHLAVKDLDISTSVRGKEARVDYFNLKVGKSDVSVKGKISDLPAILHHTDKLVVSELEVKSRYLDIYELTNSGKKGNKPVNEQIENFNVKLALKSSAKAILESPNLPVGEFFIDDLYAKMKHYPHMLHDFEADVMIDKRDLRIIDFKGEIDKSDFHFAGKLFNYDLWFMDKPLGDTKIEFALDSRLLQLEDLFSYGGENYVPQDYRHEEFGNLKVHGFADLHFNNGLRSTDLNIDQIEAKMKVHPLRFEKFSGRFHIENHNLKVEKFAGKIGGSSFVANMNYYFGSDLGRNKGENFLYINSPQLDLDELFNYNPAPVKNQSNIAMHDSVFNLFEIPFTDMSFHFGVKHLKYHRILLDNFNLHIRTKKNHHIYIDSMSVLAAGGKIQLKGDLDGSSKSILFFNPNVSFQNVDLDKLLFKFENFGQDHLVSEQLRGKITGRLYGQIHVHTDLVPIIDDSEVHLDLEVVDGQLINYGPMMYFSEYFQDKNLKKVSFDTLVNHIDINKGRLSIPKMLVNSSLGFIELSGKQDMDFNFDYYLRIPLKLATKEALGKLLNKKPGEVDPNQTDEIATLDPAKKVKFINLRMKGNPDNFKISLAKDKKKG